MYELASIIIFALCMRIKGGGLGTLPWYKSSFANKIEGAYISGLILSAFVNPIFGAFWILGNRPAMDDPSGPDWKRAIQRGVFLGACLTLATGITQLIDPYYPINVWYIVAAAGFPIYYRMGLKIDKTDWWIGELLLGGALGLAHII